MEVEDYKYERINTTTPNEEKRNSPISYFQLYKFSTILEKILLLVAAIFSIVSGVFEVLFSVFFGKCVGAIANYGTDLMAATNETEKLDVEKIFMSEANEFATMAGTIALIVFFSFYVSTSLFNYTAMRQSFKIRELYFNRVITQDIPWHDQSPTGDFASRITDDLRKIQDGFNDKASMSIYHITVIIAGVVQSLILGWKLTLVCLASFPVSFLTMACIGKLSTKLAKDESEVYGEAGKVADETFTYIKTVTAFAGQREEMKRYDRFLAVARKNNIRRYFFVGLTNGVTVFFMNIGIALAIWYGVTLIMEGNKGNGDYNIAKLVTIYNSIIMSTSNVGAITPFLETFNSAKGAAAKIFSIIEEEPVITKSYETGTKIDKMKGNIEFRTVDFSYPARKQVKVLKKISLKISAGETVALVGSSGCGKSTIIQLVQRFYDADQGQIYIDGFEIGDLSLNSLRNRIGLVGQEPVLFDGTIAENIRLGNLSATQADVEEAAKKSNAHSFILSFPNGYRTVIGERGTQLSGGQKQRIAIARALVRKPAILLLDEATSALDSNSEAVVQATLDKVGKNCTTIIVAHRLSTVRKADRIIVLENGTVVEDGSHDALMVTKGIYYNLVVTQLSGKEQDDSSRGCDLDSSLSEENSKIPSINLTKVEKDHEKIINFTTVWKIFMANLSPKWCIVVGVISSIIFGIALILCMIVLGKSLAIMSGTDEKYVVSQVNTYAFQLIIIGIVLGISSIVQAYFIGIAGENLTLSLRSSMFETIIHQEIGWFDRTENGVGSLGARLAGEPSNVQNAIGLCTGPFLNVITMTLLLLGVGFYMSWKLLLGFFGFIPLLVIILYLEQKVLVRENLKSMEVLEQSTKLAVEAISNIRTVASLAMEKYFHNRYMMKLQTYRRLTIRNIHMQGIVYGLSKGSLSLSYIITIFYGAYLIKNKETDAATVIGLTEVFATSIGNLTYTLVFLSNLTKGFVACNLIYDLLNRVPKIKNVVGSAGEAAIEGDVEYKSVSFSYPTRRDIEIFKDLNLIVLKGTTVALVGPSGCGKSTIVQLLLRFYDSDSGQVTFGEEDITKINLGLLRLRLGIVMQEPNLFSRTIGENIAYGNLGNLVSRAEVIEAAKKANIHSFISSLPLGYDTFLGEKDTQLSGGQKQRIAIARALVRNPEILLLDEATSALDAESEKVVQEALNNAREERTCIVIAHQLKTIVDADVIAVLNEGKIFERGTHHELMGMKGLYWKLYNLQLQS